MFNYDFPIANIVELDDNHRVVASYEQDMIEKPDWGNEYDMPVFTYWYRDGIEASNTSAEPYESAVKNFFNHYGRDEDLFARWVRIVFGATKLDWSDFRDGILFTFDPQEVIEKGQWVDEPEHRAEMLKFALELWRAYTDGDVYWIKLEQKVTGSIVYDDEGREDEDFTDWEEREAVHGYYGDSEVTDEALKQWAEDNTDWTPAE